MCELLRAVEARGDGSSKSQSAIMWTRPIKRTSSSCFLTSASCGTSRSVTLICWGCGDELEAIAVVDSKFKSTSRSRIVAFGQCIVLTHRKQMRSALNPYPLYYSPFSSVVERATRNGEVGCSIQPMGIIDVSSVLFKAIICVTQNRTLLTSRINIGKRGRETRDLRIQNSNP